MSIAKLKLHENLSFQFVIAGISLFLERGLTHLAMKTNIFLISQQRCSAYTTHIAIGNLPRFGIGQYCRKGKDCYGVGWKIVIIVWNRKHVMYHKLRNYFAKIKNESTKWMALVRRTKSQSRNPATITAKSKAKGVTGLQNRIYTLCAMSVYYNMYIFMILMRA